MAPPVQNQGELFPDEIRPVDETPLKDESTENGNTQKKRGKPRRKERVPLPVEVIELDPEEDLRGMVKIGSVVWFIPSSKWIAGIGWKCS